MTHVGSNVSTMRLSLKDWDGAPWSPTSRTTRRMLGYYSPEDGWTIHIDDTDATPPPRAVGSRTCQR